MKPVSTFAFTLFIFITFSECKTDNSLPSIVGISLRFVNGMAGATKISGKVTNTNVYRASNVNFLSSSWYCELNSGGRLSTSFYTGDSLNTLCSTTTNFTQGAYSAFASGTIRSPSVVITTDDLSEPPSGYTKVRFINLSSDNLSESFFVDGQKVDSNIGYKNYTAYYKIKIDSGQSLSVSVSDPGHVGATFIPQGKVTIREGAVHTVMLTRNASASGNAALTLTSLSDL